jgi:hypothetical protein
VRLDVLVDSMPPRLRPRVQGAELILGGSDLVTADADLVYQLARAGGNDWRAVADGRIALDQARGLGNFLDARVVDQAGNATTARIDLAALTGQQAGGCAIGRSAPGAGALVLLILLVVARRRRAALAGLALLLFGCGDDTQSCKQDADCASLPCAASSIAMCADNQLCECSSTVPLGRIGQDSSLAVAGGQALVSAYNDTYGDLMLGRVTPPGVVTDWEFVDGVPDGPVVLPQSMVRHGIRAAGEDVGHHTAIAATPDGQARIAYYDATNGALKLALSAGHGWTLVRVDGGPMGSAVGRFIAMSLRPSDQAPGIAYYADLAQPDGSHRTELRFAQARTAEPGSASDFTITVIATATLAAPVAAGDLPPGTGLFPAIARLADGRPVIAFYDRARGNLMLATAANADGASFALRILDGEDAMGRDTGDVGLHPALAIEQGDVVSIVYGDAIRDQLLYVSAQGPRVELVDDGFRIDGKNAAGLDQPVDHFVGADNALVAGLGLWIAAYQDQTSHELLTAIRGADGRWTRHSLAGANPDDGAFGFFTSMQRTAGSAYISSYVVNQRTRPPKFFVQVFAQPLGPQ